jgi:hypothetical protein
VKERIDHSNYEAWLLDRLEGNLSPQDERALEAFLAANPGLDPGQGSLPTLDDLEATLSASAKNELKRQLPPTGAPSNERLDDHLIARLEGDLTPLQLEALRLYLIEHPEHQRAERLYALTKVLPDAMACATTHDLERNLPPLGMPTRYTVDDFLVARLEGDLTPSQEQVLNTFLARHPEARVAADLFAHTRITVPAAVYPDHAGLKKGGRVVPLMPVWAVRFAAAASLALLFGAGIWFLTRNEVPQTTQVAERTEEPTRTIQPTDPALKVEQVSPSGTPAVDGTQREPQPEQFAPGNKGVVTPAPERRTERPVSVPLPKEQPVPLVAQELPPLVNPSEAPTDRPVLEQPVPPRPNEGMAMAALPAERPSAESTTLVGLMARTLRERVLDQEAPNARPLDGDDALAAVDRGLRTLGGEHAGIDVARNADGALRSFKLRLGSNLSISASR